MRSRRVRGRSARLAVVLAASALLAACGLPAPPTPGGPDPTGPIDTTVATALLARVNEARLAGRDCGGRGVLPPTHALRLESRLVLVAQAHSDDMHANERMSHTGSDGSDPGDRIRRAGYVPASWGENVARGYVTVDAVMAGWLGSDGHCANLMSASFTEFGGGESGRYWTQVFARPR